MQKELPLRVKRDLSEELNEAKKLHDSFEVTEIVIHFLGKTGGKPSLPLREYLVTSLKMDHHSFSSKVLIVW